MEKERQERRKASLRRLMARKEQRALQQVGKRRIAHDSTLSNSIMYGKKAKSCRLSRATTE